ncbi:MAG TPA: hypothetical protein P5079_02525 [Elusimicrobiota bacterium]|nr:hypothetical protein [Elusimicrobiota bacterium]
MNRHKALHILNPVLGLLFANQALTGLFHRALSAETFEVLHEGAGLVLIAAVAGHVALNWGWIKSGFKRTDA